MLKFKRNEFHKSKNAISTYNQVEYVNICAIRLLFLQVVEKVPMFDMNLKLKVMKRLITILFIGLISFSVNAQDKKVAKIEFKTETIDYGTIEKGADGVRVFEFTNTGNAPLIISKVSSTCGCTIPKKPKEPILPGKTGEIEVKYDTKRVMPIRKTITVISNAETPTVALKIKGLVVDSSKESVLNKKNKSVIEQ